MKNEKETSKLYLKTHNQSKVKYLGITAQEDVEKYLGSGTKWMKHIKSQDRWDVTTEILFEDDMIGNKTSAKFQEICKQYSKLYNVVEDEEFANLKHEDGVLGAKGNTTTKYDYKGEKHLIVMENEYNDSWEENPECIESAGLDFDSIEDTYLLDDTNPEIILEQQHNDKAVLDTIRCMDISNFFSKREKKVICMRFGIDMNKDHTLEEVGKQFDVTRDRIRQIEAKALRKLRHPLKTDHLKHIVDANHVDGAWKKSA